MTTPTAIARACAALGAALAFAASAAIAAETGSGVYTVECDGNGNDCRVDLDTYVGWRTYNGNCARCHGEAALGSSLAPNLLERITRKEMQYEQFEEIVTDGVRGQMGVMPGWGQNPNVMSRLEHLWGYLKARTDGVLPPGRPQKLAEKQEDAADRPSNWE